MELGDHFSDFLVSGGPPVLTFMVLTSEASLEKNERYVVIWLSEPHGTFDFDLQSLIYFPLNYTIGQQPAAATAGQHCALGWPPIFVGHCHQPSCEEL